ncbi:nuclear transport factor 2 family protein [Teredinibacter sp. KSP-S5-2]|uniref:nuclear transport factor 2 family protein n=1 Tax=Teredinibacter sp. KSP-S5-2 TaxID=3034506 RepID=UPI0029344FAD|nr:nuclear transport factor 2 family protein [Teredinibacter sp. KSP-S5-2]WNO10613.1 nuclear transport factor 2 family protein [Teredinibacter sp. KSP-S5-2]
MSIKTNKFNYKSYFTYSALHYLFRIIVTGSLALLLTGCLDRKPGGSEKPVSVEVSIKNQADLWDLAIVNKDRTAILSNMAEEFRQIDGTGNIKKKAEFVDGLMSPRLEIRPYTVEDYDLRVYGDVALLSGRTRMKGKYDGEDFTAHYRYIDVYVKRLGEWKIVSVQITELSN